MDYREFEILVTKNEASEADMFGFSFEESYSVTIDNMDLTHKIHATEEVALEAGRKAVDRYLTHPLTGEVMSKSERQERYPDSDAAMKITAIAAHFNGSCYSTDGEEWCEYDSAEDAISAADGLLDLYSTDADGNECDVDLEWWINYGNDLIKTVLIKSSAAERAQEECTVVASHVGEYTTDYIGTNDDDELVKWSANGGNLGAHDRMTNDGWREKYETPTEIEPGEWLSLGIKYGADVTALLPHDEIVMADLDNIDSDAAWWLDADDQPWELPCCVATLPCGKRIAWTDTDEAGIDDIQILDGDTSITEFAEELAEGLGERVIMIVGAHYTSQGVQHQHQASGRFDQGGFEMIFKPACDEQN